MPNKQPNVATGEGQVPTKKTKKPSSKKTPKPASSKPKGVYDWGDGKGKIHSIPLDEHEQNVEARGYGINLNQPVSAPLSTRQAYGQAEQAADRVYQPQIQGVRDLEKSVPTWFANYQAQVAAQQAAAQTYAQPMLDQANAGVQNTGQTAPGLDPGSAQYATDQQAAKGRQSIAQLGASSLAAIPTATNAYMGAQAATAARELPQVLAGYGQQRAGLEGQRGNAVAENYGNIRQAEQNAAIAYGTLGLNTNKAAADTDLARGVDPVTGRPLPQEAPTGYGAGAPGLNSFGYTHDEWSGMSAAEKAKARAAKGGGQSQADKDEKAKRDKEEKKRAAIQKATGRLKTRIGDAKATWERYARAQNPATKFDESSKEYVPDIDPKTGKQRTKKATPDQIKAQMRKDGYSETEIHVMLMIRAGKKLTKAEIEALKGTDPNIRIPREWLKDARSSGSTVTRPGNAPGDASGTGQSRPT